MKKEEISDALSYLDDDLLEQTNKLRMNPRKPSVIRRIYSSNAVRWCAAAAVLIICVGTLGKDLLPGAKAQKAAQDMFTGEPSMNRAFLDMSDDAGRADGRLAESCIPVQDDKDQEQYTSDMVTNFTTTAENQEYTKTSDPKSGYASVNNGMPLAMDVILSEHAAGATVMISVSPELGFEFGPEWYLEYENVEGVWKTFEPVSPIEWTEEICGIGNSSLNVTGVNEWSINICFSAYDFESLPDGTTVFRICKPGWICGSGDEPVREILTYVFERR